MLKILLPVDGSERALHAVRHALALVHNGLQAEFVLANVQAPATLYEMVVVHDAQALHAVSDGAGAHLLQPAQALLEAGGVRHTSVVETGDPASMLVELVERLGCDAIVMGAHGGTALRNALMGSVSQAVVHASPVPVTLVRHADD